MLGVYDGNVGLGSRILFLGILLCCVFCGVLIIKVYILM